MCYSLIYKFFFSWDIASFHFKLCFYKGSFQIDSTRLENTDYIWNPSSNMRCHLHLKSMVQIIISKVQFFFFIRKETYQVSPVWSTLVYPVYFGPFRSIRSTSFTSVKFGPLRSILVLHLTLFDKTVLSCVKCIINFLGMLCILENGAL